MFTPRKAKGIPEPKEHGPWGELNRCLGCDSAYPLGALLRYGDPGYKPTVQEALDGYVPSAEPARRTSYAVG